MGLLEMKLFENYWKWLLFPEVLMLYPDFNDLVAFKDRKSKLVHTSRKSVKSTVPGNHHSPFRGQGLEFDAVREYVPGDDIRSIDWRVTARTGSPHLKIFKEDRERHMIICVDMNSTMRFGTRNTFKSVQSARIAALLGWQGLANHDNVSACLFGDVPNGLQYFASQKTKKSFTSMLKMLAEPCSEDHNVPIHEAVQHISKASRNGSLIYLISDFMDLDKSFQNESSLSKLNKSCDVIFISVNDPADKALFPVGKMGFCSSLITKCFVNTDSMAGREAYSKQWSENRKRLYEITSKFKIPLIELTTESEVHRDLMLGMKSLAQRKYR
jgi:uncharacterized protein (DUF58 family)